MNATYGPGRRLDPGGEGDDAPGDNSGYAPTHYPGTRDPARAIALTARTGDELSSTDFFLEPTATYSVRGHVRILGMRRSRDGVVLVLEPRKNGRLWSTPTRQTTVAKGDNSFEISDALPGAYPLIGMRMNEGRRFEA